jgi:hypothetical protein
MRLTPVRRAKLWAWRNGECKRDLHLTRRRFRHRSASEARRSSLMAPAFATMTSHPDARTWLHGGPGGISDHQPDQQPTAHISQNGHRALNQFPSRLSRWELPGTMNVSTEVPKPLAFGAPDSSDRVMCFRRSAWGQAIEPCPIVKGHSRHGMTLMEPTYFAHSSSGYRVHRLHSWSRERGSSCRR